MHSFRQFAAHAAIAAFMAGDALATSPFSLQSSSLMNANATCDATSEWPGWSGIKYAFTFGDSYSQTGFNYSATPAPSQDNPLGNPAYPGWTSSSGQNWIEFLTTKYNASRLQTYNLAHGGATVDGAILNADSSTWLSVKRQVYEQFLPGYTSHGSNDSVKHPLAPDAPAWTSKNSLFAVWVGINDIGGSYWLDNVTAVNDKIFAVYGDLMELLYREGARNFLFLTVPPFDRSPSLTSQPPLLQTAGRNDIAMFNDLLRNRMAADLKANHTDSANVWVVDTQIPFNAVLDNAATYPQTAQLKNLTTYCDGYGNTYEPDAFNASCGVPVNEYFWLNTLHPTYPIHDVVAEQVSRALDGGPNVCSTSYNNSDGSDGSDSSTDTSSSNSAVGRMGSMGDRSVLWQAMAVSCIIALVSSL